jgi:hypothetical protein
LSLLALLERRFFGLPRDRFGVPALWISAETISVLSESPMPVNGHSLSFCPSLCIFYNYIYTLSIGAAQRDFVKQIRLL